VSTEGQNCLKSHLRQGSARCVTSLFYQARLLRNGEKEARNLPERAGLPESFILKRGDWERGRHLAKQNCHPKAKGAFSGGKNSVDVAR